MRRGREQEVAALGRQREQAAVDEVVQRVRHGERLAGLDRDARAPEHADDLERVERVSARRLVHLREERARERDPEMLLDDVVQRRDVERADVDLA